MENLIELLNKSGFNYEIIEHEETIHSAKDGAKYFNIEVGQTAPTLILSTEKGLMGFITSGNREKIDFEELGNELDITINGLAKKAEVESVTGFSVGTVPLILKNLQCIIDSELFKYEYVYGGTGSENHTLKISPKSLLDLNNILSKI